ncbi:MAG: TetR family transcriptional regulator [Micavibrio sp.]|nr:TetR family transcriptional regulator [Micavibrio sp.]|tara:strand:+ start:432 stop:1085 length:654 start_codon:yes stop_codon:yes gene_type:complete
MYVVKTRTRKKAFIMRRTKEEADKTRETILDTATALFATNGVTKTTLEDIAKAANVTRGAIYWHFKNKTEIFEALHDRLHRPFVEMIMQDLERDHDEPIEQLKDLCINLMLDLQKNEQKRQALILFNIKCDYAGELSIYKEKYRQEKKKALKLFAKYFERARDKGKLRDGEDPDMLCVAVQCFCKGILHEYLDNPTDKVFAKKIPILYERFFSYMGK